MGYLNFIFGCIGRECPDDRCFISTVIRAYPTATERFRWWNSLPDEDKEHMKSNPYPCEGDGKS